MKISHKIIYSTCILIFSFWVIMAFGRTVINFSKIFTEEKQWIFLSDEEKRHKIYGNVYIYLKFINAHTKGGTIISFFDDIRTHYYGRFFLYPKQFTNFVSSQLFIKELSKNTYAYVSFGINISHQGNFESMLSQHKYIKMAEIRKDNFVYLLYTHYE